ncbi:UDP-glucose 4-epimerase GalE [Ectothiorhodospiraceae bacterium BW-2]|nr:UDP-glucose 4-epimerase GalE [Ectothiorhodospiraceae bacterium BW-2]
MALELPQLAGYEANQTLFDQLIEHCRTALTDEERQTVEQEHSAVADQSAEAEPKTPNPLVTEAIASPQSQPSQRTVLVVGGAGYIGSHMVYLLLQQGYRVVTFDNLSAGYRDAVVGGEFIEGDIGDSAALDRLLQNYTIDGVMHFASSIQVGESVTRPDLYYHNNLANTINLLNALVRHQVKALIFSSTAAIFGQPQQIPLDENHPQQPINPYGRTKWMVELLLQDYDHAFGLKSVALRYFNAAGAEPGSGLRERHDPETHLIPLTLQVALGQRPAIAMYGNDYETADGSCIRDYIHVSDLCRAHILALEKLWQEGQSLQFNLGNGEGYSVQQVIDSCRRITGHDIPAEVVARRAGDPAVLVADSQKAEVELGWQPRYRDLDTLVEHAWQAVRG